MRGARLRGFTFIEMMVVITLIGIMATLIVGNLDGLTSRSTLNASARELGNTILFIRDRAALQARELALEIDVDKQRWRTVDAPSPTDVPDPEDREEATNYGDWIEPGRGVNLESLAFNREGVRRREVVWISFDADGQLSPAGFVAYFRHDDLPEDDGASVEVTGLTGLVAYHRGRWTSDEVRDAEDD